jgi:alpha-tubulin suppressor-like RCC1 family protein
MRVLQSGSVAQGDRRCNGASAIALLCVIAALFITWPAAAQAEEPSPAPDAGPAVHYDTSPPLSSMSPSGTQGTAAPARETPPLPAESSDTYAPNTSGMSFSSSLAPSTIANFDGIPENACECVPPDPAGAAGPTQFVETANTDFAVYSKTGTAVLGPEPTNTLWSGFGGSCETQNDGDATVLYDTLAQRWVVEQFAIDAKPNLECIAVSETSDATGKWHRYSFEYSNEIDYPKIGVWPDAYYISYNLYSGGFIGSEACALHREAMLKGEAATQQCFIDKSGANTLQPATIDGSTPPPTGEQEWFVSISPTEKNALAWWRFHVNWTNPSETTFTGPTNLAVEPFTTLCGNAECVPQAETTRLLQGGGQHLMYRLVYRNFGTHQSILATDAILTEPKVGEKSAGMRWYELRPSGSALTVYQQGTYSPDGAYRWMGSIAMDGSGDMALGYSVSSSSLHPQIRYTGRLVTDPLGTMPQGETTVYEGAGSQTTAYRWGDYTEMSIDPSDECTFWYVNEYIPSNGGFNWHTRIASFKYPSCGTPTVTSVVPNEGPEAGGTSVTITGTHFTGATAVKFGTTAATKFEVKSETSITATAPAHAAGTVDVTVTTPAGTSATSSADHYTYRSPPTVTAVSPDEGLEAGGTSVTITGTHFTGATAVKFGTTAATKFEVKSETSITATSPAHVGGTVDVTVTTAGGTSATSSADHFTYLFKPAVTSVVPNEGPEAGGTSVTITGTHFTGATAVKFGTVAATKFEVKSETSIVATAPAEAAATVDVTVTTPGGTSATGSADHYTYRAKPAVANLQPNAGTPSGGTTVMISGTSFTGATKVSFGATTAASFTVISATWISAVSPAGTGTVNVTVTSAGGTSATGSADQFVYRLGGVVLGWGTNGAGELGDGTSTGPETCEPEPEACSRVPVPASGPVSEASSVAAGQDHSLAVLKTGSVNAWGDNSEGELGNGTTTNSTTPVVVSGITTATAAAAGREFSLALLKSGTVEAWGYNASCQLGNGTTTSSDVPVAVSGLSEAAGVSAGVNHSLAVLKNGTVMAWGANASGQLGNGTTTGSDVPVKVSGVTEAVAVSAGGEFSLAVLKNGTVMSWGYNGAGQLGNGTTTSSDVPVKVSSISEVVTVAAGSAHALALQKTGSMMSWGANQSGQLGNDTCCEQSTVPVKVSNMTEATAIAAGFHSLAMLRGGTIEDWGRNSWGQLGDGTNTGPETCETRACSKVPVAVSGLTGATSVAGGVDYALAVGLEARPKPTVANVQPNAGAPSGGTTVMISGTGFTGATSVKFGSTSAASFTVISETWISAVSPAGSATVDVTVTTAGGTSATGSADQFVYRSGGTSLGWGDNSGGELGDGTRTGPETCGEEACSRIPVAASGPVSATAVSAGLDHSLALLSGGTAMSWGENAAGELGNGTTTASDVPVKVNTITTATAVSAGTEYSLALLKSGAVDSWGYNGSGQLGNGTTTNSDVPVAVSAITEATAISAGETHALALLKNGSVMAWGTNASGQLGNGTTTGSDVPVKVSGITEAVAVSAGYEFSLAVLKNGTVVAWGYNGAGQLGNGTTTSSDVPVAVSSLSEVVSVAAGSAHALALLKGGTMKSWGANQSGQLGDDTCCEHSTVPVKVSNITEATAISAGYHSVTMLRNGTVQDWGRNSVGQLGDGTNTGPETCDDEGSERSCSKIPIAVSSLTGAISIEGGVNYALAVGL